MVLRLILLRLVLAVGTIIFVSAFVFWAAEVLPGDVATRVLGREATEAQYQVFRERLHLDRPLYERYWLWLQGAVRVDFGQALTSQRQVTDIVAPRLRSTLLLAVVAFAFYVPVTLILATLSAVFRDRPVDGVISTLTLIGLSMPEFVLGTILLFFFAVIVPLVPVIAMIDQAKTPLESFRILLLPAVTLTVVMSAYAIRMLRDNLIEVLDSEFIRMAVLKGLPRWRVLLRHALPNALAPTLNVTALNLVYLIGGVVVVERVFAYPGLGNLLVDAISLRDAPVIEAIVLIASVTYILANLIADVGAILANPRMRTA